MKKIRIICVLLLINTISHAQISNKDSKRTAEAALMLQEFGTDLPLSTLIYRKDNTGWEKRFSGSALGIYKNNTYTTMITSKLMNSSTNIGLIISICVIVDDKSNDAAVTILEKNGDNTITLANGVFEKEAKYNEGLKEIIQVIKLPNDGFILLQDNFYVAAFKISNRAGRYTVKSNEIGQLLPYTYLDQN